MAILMYVHSSCVSFKVNLHIIINIMYCMYVRMYHMYVCTV